MIQPTLTELATTRDMVDTFLGYNHNLRIGGGEFYDMKNLTSSYYPVLSPRSKRGVYASHTDTHTLNPQGMIAKDALCYVDGTDFVINGYHIDLGLSADPKDCPKQLVSMGAYVIILPDAKWVNTANWNAGNNTFNGEGGSGAIDEKFESISPVTFTLTRIDSEAFDIKFKQASEPEMKDDKGTILVNNGDIWLDQSSVPHSLKQFSESSGMWVSLGTTYIKIQSTGIGKGFEQYDGITISGLKGVALKKDMVDDNGQPVILDGHTAEQISAIDGNFVIWDKGDNYITIVGILDTEETILNVITVERKMPVMDFIVESENRLWGCRYGTDHKGNVVNEIYASKLGDFKNWNCFMGLSTDSYVASCGTDGQFTGAITHLGYPIFFKENFMHKVYGNYPANYQIQTTTCRGVEKGSSQSLAIVNEVLYYKSRSGICAYDGSLPVEISSLLGEVKYSDAVAGSHSNKYYISMKDATDEYNLFVYDTAKGLWHKEDNTQVGSFCSCRGDMYYIDCADKKIKTITNSENTEETAVSWMAETGVLGTSMPDKKYISRLLVRMSLAIGTKVTFSIQYDSMGEWEKLFTMVGTSLRTFNVPIRPRRCDHFRLRIEGLGEAKIFSITKTNEQGSDV